MASERSKSNTIIACMTDGILVINREGLVVLRNAAAARILPGSAKLPLPFPLSAIESPDVREIIGVVTGAPGGFMILSREITLGEATYQVNVSPVLEPGGEGGGQGGGAQHGGEGTPETAGAVAVFRDVTALKKLETAKSMFVSMVAHEVKSPLAAAEGWLNLVLGGVLKADPAQERKMIERSVLRVKTLRTMVAELLNLTAIQTGNFTLHRAPVEPGKVVAAVVEGLRERAAERGITLTVEGAAAGEVPPVLADTEALAMIVSNLVENAIKYGRDGGRAEVRLARDGPYVSVSVRDDGIGISPEDQGKVFDEFYRARSEQTAGITGTGLGLSLVKRLAEMHEGTVRLESVPGAGSTFTVSIPAASS